MAAPSVSVKNRDNWCNTENIEAKMLQKVEVVLDRVAI